MPILDQKDDKQAHDQAKGVTLTAKKANEKDPHEDLIRTAARAKTLGGPLRKISNTGCHECDIQGFLYCKCIKNGAGNDTGGDDSAVKNPKEKAIDLDKTSWGALKDNKYLTSLSYDIPKFKITLDDLDQTKLSEKEKTMLLKTSNPEAVITEFEAFKKELAQQKVSTETLEYYTAKIIDDRTVEIRIPNREHLNAFIERLIEKNLLLIEQKAELETSKPDAESTYKTLSPFSTKLVPLNLCK